MPGMKQVLLWIGLIIVAVGLVFWTTRYLLASAHQVEAIAPAPPTGASAVSRTEYVARDRAGGQSFTLTIWYPTAGRPGPLELDRPLKPLGGAQRAPLVIAVPGLGGARGDFSVRAIELASHGFVVAAMDDVSAGQADGALAVRYDLSTSATTKTFLQEAERHARAHAAAISRLIAVLETDPPALFGTRVATARVGLLGHSLGGAAAAFLTHDPRIAGVVITDGWLYGDTLTRPPGTAVLVMMSDEAFPGGAQGTEDRINQAQDVALKQLLTAPNAFYIHVTGSVHSDFTDALYRVGGAGARSAEERLAIGATIDTCVREFFEIVLMQTPSALLSERSPYPHVRWITSSGAPTGTATAPATPSATEK